MAIRITKVYTRTGDKGDTALVGGRRVPKDDARIESYGTIDELNSVLGIVRGHRGAIKVYSELKIGTTIKVILPLSELPAQRLEQETPAVVAPPLTGRVLIIDDESMILGIAKEILEHAGFSVITAQDGEEGIALFREHPDTRLVLLDLTMPKLSGDDVFRELRKIDPRVRVLLVSGFAAKDEAERCLAEGALDFLAKPFKLEELSRAIGRYGRLPRAPKMQTPTPSSQG